MFENLEKLIDFKHGENSHQGASIYKSEEMLDYEQLNGSEPSFRDILDMSALASLMAEFFDVNAVLMVKSAMPVGAALGKNLPEAFTKAFDCNPVSSINSALGFSKIVDIETAKKIHLSDFALVMAPGYDKEALEILKKDNELKIIKINTPLDEIKASVREDVKITPFGILVQDANRADLNKDLFKVQTKKKPTTEELEDAIFAWKIAKHAKSNAAVVAKDFKTLAVGQGQTNYAEALEWAVNYSCDSTKDAVLAVDCPLETIDGVHIASQSRIALIIQPGGNHKDAEIAKTCDKYEISMITTGLTHFKN